MDGAAEEAALARLVSAGADGGGRVVAYGSGPDQVVELFGEGRDRCVVVVHGGYFRPSIDRAHARPVARALAAAGWVVALIEYRRVPGDPGATVADLRAADAALRAWGLEPEVWVGHSAGGTLVLLRALAADLPHVRVVALAPVADLAGAVRDGLGDGAVAEWVGESDLGAVDPVALLGRRDDHGGVVDQHVDPAQDGDGLVGEAGHLRGVGQVGLSEAMAGAGQAAHYVACGLLVAVVVDQDTVTAPVGGS